MSKIIIRDLHVSTEDREILKGLNLEINEGETIALLGPNGNGKSTLLQTIMGNPRYHVTQGSIFLDNIDLLKQEVDERNRLGIFLAMQNPSEVPGVNNADFLKASLNAHREKPIRLAEFYRLLDEAYKEVNIPFEFSSRNLNEGFSGGEKKKNEILQMLLLSPKFSMLDEIDSGLDVDAINVVSKVIQKEQAKGKGFLIVSHYARLYDLIKVDRTLILVDGKIALEGDKNLIKRVDQEGYTWLENELGISLKEDKETNDVSLGICLTKEAMKKDK